MDLILLSFVDVFIEIKIKSGYVFNLKTCHLTNTS